MTVPVVLHTAAVVITTNPIELHWRQLQCQPKKRIKKKKIRKKEWCPIPLLPVSTSIRPRRRQFKYFVFQERKIMQADVVFIAGFSVHKNLVSVPEFH